MGGCGSITANQVLAHAWINGKAPANDLNRDNLMKHNAARKLKKAGQKLMALNRLKAMGAAAI